jgi:hypothetical protein
MVAVVVLVPIVLMAVACLLERFEARAVAPRPQVRSRRPVPAAEIAEPAEPAVPALALVHGDDEDEEDAAPDRADDDPVTVQLPRAS